MSETVTRQRPSIDLDAFERRLQAQTQRHHEDDPLAELARIVGERPDPYDDVFAQPQLASAAEPAGFRPAGFRPSFEPHQRQEPSLGAPPPRFSADFSAIEAGLRGATPQAPTRHAERAPAPAQFAPPTPAELEQAYAEPAYAADVDYGYAPEPQLAAVQEAAWGEPARPQAKRGAGRPVYAMAASIAVAVIGIGVAFAYKGTGSSPREIKTIMAAAGPTKIQPPAEQPSDQGDQDVNALGQQPAPTKLVSREEQPVDLSQAVQDNAARDAANHGTDAASVPVPLSPAQAAGTASPDYAALGGAAAPDAAGSSNPSSSNPSYGDQGFGVGMPRPKRVKSVSVRPDGTIVNDGPSAPSATPQDTDHAKSSDRADPIAALTATTPKAAPLKTATSRTPAPKSSARASMRAAQPADDGDAAPEAAPPAKPTKTKPVRVASTETGAQDATADAADEAKPAGAGGFAVQLAAPASEADARSATSRFLKKYAGPLHGHRLGFHRAESNGHTVYRVRVSSLTREDAASLCSKLKSDGGTCFVAKD